MHDPKWIAMKRTSDGVIVHLWPDGAITWALGVYIKGSPRPRTDEAREIALRAGWLVMGEVEIYDASEVPDLIAAARWTAARGGNPGMLRARLHAPARLMPYWVTIETDRSGAPVVQTWRLPRMRWPGLVVWREHSEYSVLREIGRTGTHNTTGFKARNLKDLRVVLEKIAVTHCD